jgi:membrane protein DedA with SNARE-associated domain
MEDVSARLAATLIAHGYVVILVIMAVEEAGIPLPIPGDGLLLLAGYLVSTGALSLPGSLVAATAGALIGASILYWVARRGGRALVLRFGRYLRLSERHLDRLAGLFDRLRPVGPGVARLIPGLRIYASALAGLAAVPYPVFVFNVAWACTVWALAFIVVGYLVGARWREFLHRSGAATAVSIAILGVLLVAWWSLRRWRSGQVT